MSQYPATFCIKMKYRYFIEFSNILLFISRVFSRGVFILTTETIVHKLKNGDIQVLRLIYELFYKSVFQAAFFITDDANLAEDTVHEVFLLLPNKIEQLKDPSRLEAWLCRIAANTARNIIRDRSKERTFLEENVVYYPDNQSNSPDVILLDNEEKQIIREYIRRLKPDHKHVVYLKYYSELPVDEISAALGIPAGTVKTRLFRAREKIRKLIDPESGLSCHKIKALKEPEGVK